MKINSKNLKKLIKEYISSNPNMGASKMFNPTLGFGNELRNYPSGDPPNNQDKVSMAVRDEYEQGIVRTFIEDGETYVTQGKNVYHLTFNENKTCGSVEPVGQHEFHIIDGRIEWNGSVPANVKYDSSLNKQILEYAGIVKGAI